jgi:uncharacterized protein (TIGR02270 family)
MNSMSIQRPIGFSPQEISAMTNEVVVAQHAENAAFLWTQRDRAVHAPNYSLRDLADLDERVEANLDGLRVAWEAGWKLCDKALENPGRGEVFAASVLALGSEKEERIQKVLAIGATDPALEQAVISALGWLSFNQIKEIIKTLMSSEKSEFRRIAIGAYAVHRTDPGEMLKAGLSDSQARVRTRALRAAGELGRKDLLPTLRQAMDDQERSCRFWATWSVARLGDRTPAIFAKLREYVENNSEYAGVALAMVLRCMEWKETTQWRHRLRENPTTLRAAVMGIGILGDPALVPELISYMENKHMSRIAGESFSMITGVDLAYADLDCDQPKEPEKGKGGGKVGNEFVEEDEEKEEEVKEPPDDNLPWPNPELVGKWWHEHRQEFEMGKRYLRGKPLILSALQEVLEKGNQRQREAAALERAIWKTEEPLLEVRAPGNRQL